MPKPLRHILAPLCLAAAIATPAAAHQPGDLRIELDPVAGTATIESSLTGHATADYRFGGRSGQTMSADVAVIAGEGPVFFDVLPPGSDYEAMFVGRTQGRAGRMSLAESGDYTLRLYLWGDAREGGRTVGYRLRVALD
ncbi:hypothetical protein [Pseudooceanicola nanhaiensis]|uniref:hypothetical protein n=1 Tax=Pseudooceanicola nanhaiensis TaxID=375761 RepID=UPI0035175CAD